MLHHSGQNELKLLIVGDYLFEPQSGLLSGPSGAHHMCSQMSLLLCRMIERAGQVVDREALISEIWPDAPQGAQRLVSCIGRPIGAAGTLTGRRGSIETRRRSRRLCVSLGNRMLHE